MKKKVSLIVACRNEQKYIGEALKSLLTQDYPKEFMELLIIDGRSEDDTLQIVNNYQKEYPFIKVHDNPLRVATHAFNIGIQNATGDYIFLIGSHCEYPTNYISRLVSCAQNYNANIVGGLLFTSIRNKNIVSNSIKKVLSNRFGVGNATFRTGVTTIQETDTVAYGCYERALFDKFGLFNENLIRNQDIEFNKRIVNNKGKIIIVPDVTVIYYARENLDDLAKNNFQNGYWNPLTVFYTDSFKSISLRHYVPMIFILFILFFGCLSFFSIYFLGVLAGVFLIYLTILGIVSYKINDDGTAWLQLLKTFIVIHFSYGIGSLAGLIKVTEMRIGGPSKSKISHS